MKSRSKRARGGFVGWIPMMTIFAGWRKKIVCFQAMLADKDFRLLLYTRFPWPVNF